MSTDRTIPLVLVIDDDATMRLMIRRVLERDGFRVEEAADGDTGFVAFATHSPDVVLLDAIMPGADGFECCRQIREHPKGKRCPLLMITGLDDDRSVDRAFEAGASDYVTKPIHWAVLRQRVRRLLGAARAERQVHHQARHDALTGLPNRLFLDERFRQMLAEARRYGHRLALVFMDLDRFKLVNDTLGHGIGDRLLQDFAARLVGTARETDTVARLGGDEFLILANRIACREDTALIAQRVLQMLRQPPVIDGHVLNVTPSVGIAVYPEDGETLGELIQRADMAMYGAKNQGGNRFEFYRPEIGLRVSRRWTLEQGLRWALKRDELVLHYQPVVALSGKGLYGVEALVRWQAPDEGLVSPGEFIPLAEETGLIVSLGERVLEMACAQMVRWRDLGLPPFPVSVNLARGQLTPELPAFLAGLIDRHGLPGARLTLELTESALMEPTAGMRQMLNDIKGLGVSLAIDDFGTGYSSLSYLAYLPVNALKIDLSFVQRSVVDTKAATLTAAIVALAHKLGYTVVAEGVETEKQLAFLRAQGCDAAQGYYFCPPQAAAGFEAWIESFGVLLDPGPEHKAGARRTRRPRPPIHVTTG
ncbi:MAG: putative bifunctional diguanylate cyclase/phosphodiesterase [Gammaproteobacteria bacterium]